MGKKMGGYAAPVFDATFKIAFKREPGGFFSPPLSLSPGSRAFNALFQISKTSGSRTN